MSHYEERLQNDLAEITRRVANVSDQVRVAVDGAMQAIATRDAERMYLAILQDLPINREVRAIDALCHAFIARHLPAAHHLRFVSSVLRLAIALERMGDYAVGIARVGVRMEARVPPARLADLVSITLDACLMLEQAARAFVEEDLDLAVATKPIAKRVDERLGRFFDAVLGDPGDLSMHDAFSILSIASRLERVSDQAKNVCEEAEFVVTGRTKPPKIYRVAFIDAHNDVLGPLAVALAAKGFPNSGTFFTAGWDPAPGASTELAALAAQLGVDTSEHVPTKLGEFRQSPADVHVIVQLEGDDTSPVPRIPFETALLRWRMAPPPPGAPPEHYAALVRDLGVRIRGLMELIRGEHAD